MSVLCYQVLFGFLFRINLLLLSLADQSITLILLFLSLLDQSLNKIGQNMDNLGRSVFILQHLLF